MLVLEVGSVYLVMTSSIGIAGRRLAGNLSEDLDDPSPPSERITTHKRITAVGSSQRGVW